MRAHLQRHHPAVFRESGDHAGAPSISVTAKRKLDAFASAAESSEGSSQADVIDITFDQDEPLASSSQKGDDSFNMSSFESRLHCICLSVSNNYKVTILACYSHGQTGP